ncbi:MAG: MlaD family protein [Planctomycetales bacterium]|nr:MlaD family protein [Planctomycetales bacterium]
MKLSNESKVGGIFLVFCTILLWLTVTMKGCPLTAKTVLVCRFDTTEGLKKGDDVIFGGIPVGKVDDLSLTVDGCLATLALERGKIFSEGVLVIPAEVEVYVEDTTMLGGKRIVIVARPRAPGMKHVPMDLAREVAGRARAPISRSFSVIGERLSEILAPEGPIGRAATRIEAAADDLSEILRTVREGKGTIGKLVQDDRVYEGIARATEGIARVTEAIDAGKSPLGRLVKDEKMGESLSRAVEALGEPSGTVGKLLHSSELHDELVKTVHRLGEVGDSLMEGKGTLGKLLLDDRLYEGATKTVENLGEITQGLKEGKGALGRLLTDEDVSRNLRDMSENLRKISESASGGKSTLGLLVTEDKLYRKAEELVDTGNTILGSFTKFKTYAGLSYKYHDVQDLSVTRIYLRIEPSADKFFYAAVAILGFDKRGEILYEGQTTPDHDDDSKLVPEAQIGFRFFERHLAFRLGFLEGKLGGGLDLDFSLPGFADFPMRMGFEARYSYEDEDLRDEEVNEQVDPFVLRFEWSVMVLDHVRLYVGADNLFNRVGATVGVAFEYRDDDIRSLVGFLSLGR